MKTKHQIWVNTEEGQHTMALGFGPAKKHLTTFGITLSKDEDGEYRMNKGNREATAYYTDDIEDAIATAYAQYINSERAEKSYTLVQRIDIERKIVAQVIESALAAGYSVTVDDGEEEVLIKETDQATIMAAMFSTDEDTVYFHADEDTVYFHADEENEPQAWVKFIYGNSGHDVINDYTTNIESVMAPVMELTHFYE